MLSFFPRGVLDEILNLIESVSEGFPSYSYSNLSRTLIASSMVREQAIFKWRNLSSLLSNQSDITFKIPFTVPKFPCSHIGELFQTEQPACVRACVLCLKGMVKEEGKY